MKQEFFDLVDALRGELKPNEVLLCYLSAERSDFIRFNHALVRQAGTVEQRYLSIRLIRERRQATANVTLAGDANDLELAPTALARLRDVLAQLPEDPLLLISEEVNSTNHERAGQLAAAEEIVQQVTHAAKGTDFVGFYAGGTIYRGFANSYGQRNWHEVDSFNFDWSLYLQADKAVKENYAGFSWQPDAFKTKLDASAQKLALLETPAITLEPGEYRAYLAPKALEEVTFLMQLGGFSARSRATRQSPLLRMEHGEQLSPKVSISENTEGGVAPRFQGEGYVKPPFIELIKHGAFVQSLVSPRSAKEYGLTTNGGNGWEAPESLDMRPGELDSASVLTALDKGLYIGNLWYLNYSDKPAGRMTGMTRFATFWVEGGRIVAPVNVLRFDDTVYRMLGENLIDLTRERDLLISVSTYDERSTSSSHLPGALIEAMRFTL